MIRRLSVGRGGGSLQEEDSVRAYGPFWSTLVWIWLATSLSACCGSAPPVVTALRALAIASFSSLYSEIIGVTQALLLLTRSRKVFWFGMAVRVGFVSSDVSCGTLAFWMSIVIDGSSVMRYMPNLAAASGSAEPVGIMNALPLMNAPPYLSGLTAGMGAVA